MHVKLADLVGKGGQSRAPEQKLGCGWTIVTSEKE